MVSLPVKFSIITSTYNAGDLLFETAESLRKQTHQHFEWIVIDGASEDGTLLTIQSIGPLIHKAVSEPDSGIYEAWNKAVPFIRGDWVLFLGAGDALASPTVLGEVSERIRSLPDSVTIAYGSTLATSPETGEVQRTLAQKWQGLEGPWTAARPVLPPHPACFHRATLFRDGFRFDTKCRIAADTELLIKELSGNRGSDIGLVVARFRLGGISNNRRHRLRKIAEVIYINHKLGIFFRRPFYQIAVLAVNVIKHFYYLTFSTRRNRG
jgi:glycosyltransferase involved in cell wall biosynthesis